MILTTEKPDPIPLSDPRWVQLLKVDSDLGQQLEPDSFSAACDRIVAPSAVLERSDASPWKGHGDGMTLLFICEGLLLRELSVGRRRGAELLGPGDVICPGGGLDAPGLPVETEVRWRVLERSRVACLDRRFYKGASEWPEVVAAVTERAVRRAQALAVHIAASSLPRVEDRLLLLFWQLAGRWGRMTAEGVRLSLPLTHEVLGELVGAQRPTVTSALSRLARRGKLHREPDRSWLLAGWSEPDGESEPSLAQTAA